jgi:hypothetical protein
MALFGRNEVRGAAAIASPQAARLTGQAISLNGGVSAA